MKELEIYKLDKAFNTDWVVTTVIKFEIQRKLSIGAIGVLISLIGMNYQFTNVIRDEFTLEEILNEIGWNCTEEDLKKYLLELENANYIKKVIREV